MTCADVFQLCPSLMNPVYGLAYHKSSCSSIVRVESLSMTLTESGRRKKLNFLASVLSRLYIKVKIFAFTVNKRVFSYFSTGLI